jgi:hypothetical protein
MERSFRKKMKQACRDAEINFDPDADFDKLHQSHKHSGEEHGTVVGWETPPDDGDDTGEHERYRKAMRK